MPANQRLTFLTDGADNVRDLPLNTVGVRAGPLASWVSTVRRIVT
jgi:hypothetical protein